MQISNIITFISKNSKVLAALAIPVGIAWIFIYSQQMAEREVRLYQVEQKEHPNTDKISVDNYQLKEVDDSNHLRWQLLSKRGVVENGNQSVTLDDVKVEYFDGPDVKMRIIAPAGIANEATKYVKLSSAHGEKVAAIGKDGKAKLESETVELVKKNEFIASGGVTIEWPDVATVTGDSAGGRIDAADFKNIKLTGNTHAIIQVK